MMPNAVDMLAGRNVREQDLRHLDEVRENGESRARSSGFLGRLVRSASRLMALAL